MFFGHVHMHVVGYAAGFNSVPKVTRHVPGVHPKHGSPAFNAKLLGSGLLKMQ